MPDLTQLPRIDDSVWVFFLVLNQDELVDYQAVIAWAAAQTPPPQVTVLPGVTHFFHGRLQELKGAVFAFVGEEGRRS